MSTCRECLGYELCSLYGEELSPCNLWTPQDSNEFTQLTEDANKNVSKLYDKIVKEIKERREVAMQEKGSVFDGVSFSLEELGVTRLEEESKEESQRVDQVEGKQEGHGTKLGVSQENGDVSAGAESPANEPLALDKEPEQEEALSAESSIEGSRVAEDEASVGENYRASSEVDYEVGEEIVVVGGCKNSSDAMDEYYAFVAMVSKVIDDVIHPQVKKGILSPQRAIGLISRLTQVIANAF